MRPIPGQDAGTQTSGAFTTSLCIRLRPNEFMVCVQVKIMTRRVSQYRAKIAVLAVSALKKLL
jgi:hypothetical protein